MWVNSSRKECGMTENRLILRGALVVNPETNEQRVRDVCVADGRIADVAGFAMQGAEVIDLRGLVLCPGFTDLHVHLREPGQTHKEDIASGTLAAAAGGFTSVVAMPNTSPTVDSPEVVAALVRRNAEVGAVRVLQTAALSLGRKGRELTDAAALKQAGAVALTDDGSCIQDAGLMREALLNARSAGITVIDHCEEMSLTASGILHAGEIAKKLGLKGIPASSEELVVARDAILAAELGFPVHVQHLSSARSVSLVRWAKEEGIPLSAEVAPHHIVLTERACCEHGTNAKMNPPLRTERDRLAILEGLRDGTIEVIATDHAPHSDDEKARPISEAPFGVIGLETAVPLCLTELYRGGVLPLLELVAKFTTGPRRVLRLPLGLLEPGAPADFTVLDLECEIRIGPDMLRSRSRNTPFLNRICRGGVAGTMVGGKWVFRR